MKYLILSNKHTKDMGLPVWWRHNGSGYTNNPDNAGRYAKEEAEEIENGTTMMGKKKSEVAIPESRIDGFRDRYMQKLFYNVCSALENTTLEQAQQVMKRALAERRKILIQEKSYERKNYERNARKAK